MPRGIRLVRSLDPHPERAVWLAKDEQLDRLMLVKKLSAGDKEVRSAALLTGLQHPVLARIYAVHTTRSVHWLLAEYIDGTALANLPVPWPAEAVLPVLKDLAGAVVAMGDAGVVHGDLAPGNVLVDASGRTRLIDFGMTAVAGQLAGGGGTPGFAAPEVVHRQRLSVATDIWSLAALGTWLLTGECPFWHETDGEQLLLVPPSWRPVDPLSRALWGLLLPLLCLSPVERPASPLCLADLERIDRCFLRGSRDSLRKWLAPCASEAS